MGGHARLLARDEVIVLKMRRHLVVLAGPLAAAVAGVLVAAAGGTWVSPQESGDLVDVVLGLMAVALVGRFAFKVWEWWVDHIVVTDERILEASGIFTRRVASMPIAKVIDMIYVRTLPGRILGYGDMIVESAAQEQGLTRISHLPHPDDFYRTITTLVTQGLQSLLPEDEQLIPTDKDEEDTGPLPRIIV
jgi:uncharacterized membrane protein YdbT with pleckstrin-like domain